MIKALCNKRIGLGGAGILWAMSAKDDAAAEASFGATWFVEYYAADGSRGEVCGELLRVFACHLAHSKPAGPGLVDVITSAGLFKVCVPEGGNLDDSR